MQKHIHEIYQSSPSELLGQFYNTYNHNFADLNWFFRWAMWPMGLLSHFHLLLQKHRVNFEQTWHKASLVEEGSSLFNLRAPPFSKIITKYQKFIEEIKKSSSQEPLDQFTQNFAKSILGWRELKKDEFQEPYHLAPHCMVCKFISTVQIFNFWLCSP